MISPEPFKNNGGRMNTNAQIDAHLERIRNREAHKRGLAAKDTTVSKYLIPEQNDQLKSEEPTSAITATEEVSARAPAKDLRSLLKHPPVRPYTEVDPVVPEAEDKN